MDSLFGCSEHACTTPGFIYGRLHLSPAFRTYKAPSGALWMTDLPALSSLPPGWESWGTAKGNPAQEGSGRTGRPAFKPGLGSVNKYIWGNSCC